MRLSPFVAMLLYCTSFAVYLTIQQKLLNMGMSPIYLNTLCYTFAGIFLCAYLFFRNRSAFVIKSKKGLAYGIVIAIVVSIFADMLVLYGLRVGTPITWSLLVCSAPLVTYLLAIPLLKEPLTGRKLLVVVLSILGATLVIYLPGTGIDLKHGAPYFIGAVCFFGIANNLSQLAFKYISPLQLTLVRMVTASVVLFSLWPIFHVEIVSVQWGLLIVNSLVILLANFLVSYVIHKAGAMYFAIGTNMSPLIVSLLSIVVLRNWPTWMQVLGGMVIVGSIMLFQYVAKSRK